MTELLITAIYHIKKTKSRVYILVHHVSTMFFCSFYTKVFHPPNLKFQPFRLLLHVNIVVGKDFINQLSFDFFDEKGLIVMLLKVGGNNWWTVITVLQSMINKKYFPEWHVYFSCWKMVSAQVCVTVTHDCSSILILRRNHLLFVFFFSCLKSRFAVASSPWSFLFEFIWRKWKSGVYCQKF